MRFHRLLTIFLAMAGWFGARESQAQSLLPPLPSPVEKKAEPTKAGKGEKAAKEEKTDKGSKGTFGKEEKKGDKKEETPKGTPKVLTHADRIARLQGMLDEDTKMRAKLEGYQERIVEDLRKSGMELAGIEDQIKEKAALLEKADMDPKGMIRADLLRMMLKDLDQRKQVAKEHLELMLREKNILKERMTTLDQKILQNRQALDALVEGGEEAKKAAEDRDVSPKVRQAREKAEESAFTAKVLEEEAKSLEQRIAGIRKFLDLEKDLLENERKRGDLAIARKKDVQKELEDLSRAGAPREEIEKLFTRIHEAENEAEEIRKKVQERTERLGRLQTQLTLLQHEQVLAAQAAAAKQAEAKKATEDVRRLENPFAPHNIFGWLLDHGLKIALILCGMFVLRLTIRKGNDHLVAFMIERGMKGTKEERENRAKTLAGFFHHAAMLGVLCGGGLMILDECGIPIIPLMGGAAVVGLAVAFGAQNLIRDYFYGFVILMENQYMVNDIVRIGDHAGMVERITLRMTVLRDLEGVAHFLPHGQVTAVSNLTHGWSRALFDIGVAYGEDVDQVMEVLLKIGRELRRDPLFSDLILEDPEMLGVDQFADSAVVIKFFIKTRPLMQWKVKREANRRIKKAFDELGIEIPFPHRTVYHRYETEAAEVEMPRRKSA